MHAKRSRHDVVVTSFVLFSIGSALRPQHSDLDDGNTMLEATVAVADSRIRKAVGDPPFQLAALNTSEKVEHGSGTGTPTTTTSPESEPRHIKEQNQSKVVRRPPTLVLDAEALIPDAFHKMAMVPNAPKAQDSPDDVLGKPQAPPRRASQILELPGIPEAPAIFEPIVAEKIPVQGWRPPRTGHAYAPDWSKCYGFEFEFRYGPGDLVWLRNASGDELAQVKDCDGAHTCRIYKLRGVTASSNLDGVVPVPDVKNPIPADYQSLELYDSFAPKEKVLYRMGNSRQWHAGQVKQKSGDEYLILPKRRRGQLLRSLADWRNSSNSSETRAAYDMRLLQMYHFGDPVIAWSTSTGTWRQARVLGDATDGRHFNCPTFTVQDLATNETAQVSVFMMRPSYRLRPNDYAQVRPFGAVVQVERATYQGDFMAVGNADSGPKPYDFGQLRKLSPTPSRQHGDQVMARDAENGFWYPAVISRDSEEDPFVRDGDGRWTGQYSIKWLDAKPNDTKKTDAELKQRQGNEVTQLLTEITVENCERNLFAARISKEAKCPSACSYWSEIDDAYCSFQCISQCPSFVESAAYVADERNQNCERCAVRYCRRCSPTAKTTCDECIDGYRLSSLRGSCLEKPGDFFSWIRITVKNAIDNGTAVFTSVSLLLLMIVTWYIDVRFLRALKCANATALDEFATGRRLLSQDAHGGGGLWPLATNLQRTPVAGLGLMFLMNFQFVILAMTALIFAAWIIVLAVWPDLNDVGTDEVEDARRQCAIAHWGAEVQNVALIPELLFASFTYLVIFSMSVATVVCQRLRFLRHDAENATLKDFAAICRGLPDFCGIEDAEERVKAAIENHSKEQVLGVSICWDFRKEEEQVMAAVDVSLQSLEPEAQVAPAPARWLLQRLFLMLERRGLGQRPQTKRSPEEVRKLLLDLKCSGACFVVFPTELARDKAVASASSGIPLDGEKVKLRLGPSKAEPDSVRWASFGGGRRDATWRWLRAILELTAVIILLMYFLKYPYARYVLSFSYAEKGKPNSLNGKFLMLISIIANQIIYFFSDKVAEDLHLWYTEHKQKAYLGFYLIAMVLELMMDLFFTARTTFNQLVAAGRRTYGGEKLSDLASWHEVVQTYVMQNALGNQLLDYAFPSTFLAPFLFEPLLGFIIYHTGKLIVRSHVDLSKYDAQKAVNWFWVNDLSRYGDAILNLTIAVIFLSIHGGFNARAFGYLLACHVYIYVFDHWMLLRAMPRARYNLMSVDALAHMMMCIPTGIALVCLVFKGNCKNMQEHPLGKLIPFEGYCFVSVDLIRVLILVFVAHASLHIIIVHLLLTHIRVDHKQQDTAYAELAKKTPCTWFTANPVHCLRSEHLKQHSPPCRFYVPGREHLLRANKEASCHFEDPDYYAVKPRGWHLLSNE